MIEPFEFESIRLHATLPTGTTGGAILKGSGSVDEQEIKSFAQLKKNEEDLNLDRQKLRIYQTKIGNPNSINSHQAVYANEHLTSLGNPAPNYVEPTESIGTTQSSSELLSSVLDKEMSFVPSTDLHVLPGMHVNHPERNFLNPGLTTVDSRKVNIHWSI
jgi:hypothetical protein